MVQQRVYLVLVRKNIYLRVSVCGLVGTFALAPPVFLIGVHLYYVHGGGGFLFFFVKYLNFFTVGCV